MTSSSQDEKQPKKQPEATPEPGACGDPDCHVLHADPANPIHPPWYTPPATPPDCDHRGSQVCEKCGAILVFLP